MRKKEAGDSFIGYGVVEREIMLWGLPPEEEKYCEDNEWKFALKFKYMSKFSKPYSIKESFLSEDVRRYLHKAGLNEDQVDEVLEITEEL